MEHIHSGEEEEEERQISGEDGVKENYRRRWMEESEEQPIIPDPVAVDPSLPANQTGRWIQVSCVVD